MIRPRADQERRYYYVEEFRARVDVVAKALWEAVCRYDYGMERPYPYDRLIPTTVEDLVAYAIDVVEALEEFDAG